MGELQFPKPQYYEPKVGDWVMLWTGTAHRLTAVCESCWTWLATPCGQYHCYDVDYMTPAEPSDRRCKRCEKSEVKDEDAPLA